MKVTLASAKSVAIYVLGLAAVIIGALPQTDLPAGVHATLVAVGGVIVAVERYLQGQLTLAGAK